MKGFSHIATRCDICNSTATHQRAAYNVAEPSHKALFAGRHIVRCESCGVMFIDPMPTEKELADFYANDYRDGTTGVPTGAGEFPFDSAYFLSRARSLRKLVGKFMPMNSIRRVLEIGAGYGYNLYAFREVNPNCEVVAIESDPTCSASLNKLRNMGRCDIITGFFPTCVPATSLGAYDVIIVSQVLEHLLHSREFIMKALTFLTKPTGILVVEVPNDPIQMVRNVNNAPHLYFFETTSLRKVVDRAGGNVLFCETCGPECFPTLLHRIFRMFPFQLRLKIQKSAGGLGAISDNLSTGHDDPDFVPIIAYDQYGGERVFLRAIAQAHQ